MDDKPFLIETSEGLSIKYKERFLYSKYNPKKSINKLLNITTLQSKTIYLIPSPLLGYGLKSLQKLLPVDSLFVFIEIDDNLYSITDNNYDVHLIKTGFDFLDLLKDIKFSDYTKCEIFSINGAYDLYKEKYDRLYKILLNHLLNHWKNRYTLTQMGQLWIKNCLINLKDLHKARPLSELKTCKPVVIIGAGESTETVLSMLRKNRENIFILCVDTALQILLEVDITPDCVVALEGQFYNLPDFYGSKGKKIDLIYDLSSYPSVTRNLFGKKYYTVTKFSKSSLLNKLKELNVVDNFLPPLGSVGITAIYISLQITKNSIFLAGLDFSYLRGKTHSNGTPYHKTTLITWSRTNPGDAYIQCLKRPLVFKNNKINIMENTDSILFDYSLYAKELLYGTNRVFDLTIRGMDLGVKVINDPTFVSMLKKEFNVSNIRTSYTKIFNNIDIIKKELHSIQLAILGIESYINNKSTIHSILPLISTVDYLFDHYPETEPVKDINKYNFKRFYYTLLRYKRTVGYL